MHSDYELEITEEVYGDVVNPRSNIRGSSYDAVTKQSFKRRREGTDPEVKKTLKKVNNIMKCGIMPAILTIILMFIVIIGLIGFCLYLLLNQTITTTVNQEEKTTPTVTYFTGKTTMASISTSPAPLYNEFPLIFTTSLTGPNGSIQTLMLKESGYYLLILYGAKGGDHIYSESTTYSGGKGAAVIATVRLTYGTNLSIVVGQSGGNYEDKQHPNRSATGGGGGSFVYSGDNLYAAAGGGGGAGHSGCSKKEGLPGQDNNDGGNTSDFVKSTPGGRNGTGGGSGISAGGAGWFNKGSHNSTSNGGGSRSELWIGGVVTPKGQGSPGGFGGGGAGLCCSGGGGGGGYSGGAGGIQCSGGGGGSYCKSDDLCKMIKGGNDNKHGLVKILKL